MGFETLLGNQRLRARLDAAFARGAVSHCYLITGPEGAGKKTLARLLAAAMQCTGDHVPCGTCPQCRKVLGDVHPDVITVDSDRKNVPVELIRQARADAFIRPNEGKKKVYILPRAQDLLEPAQNALLKIIEEPPPYGVFLLLCTNRDRLLPTIRSRCAELALEPLEEGQLLAELARRVPQSTPQARHQAVARADGFLGRALTLLETGTALAPQTEQFADAYAAADPLALLSVLVPMEKLDRQKLSDLLQQWLELLADALRVREGGKSLLPEAQTIGSRRTGSDLLAAITNLRQAIAWCEANVNTAHICGALAAELA
jgi:DNA polymerase-3 subunit delta'